MSPPPLDLRRPAGGPPGPAETIAMRLVALLREDIVTLKLRPGDVISESEIAARHRISRQPAREAFIRLAQQGLLLIRPKRATVIRKISAAGVRQSRFIRESLEVEIVRRLAASTDTTTGRTLAALIAAQREAALEGSASRFHELDEAFHRLLACLAGVEYAWQLIDDHKIQLDRVRYLTLSAASQQVATDEHAVIVEAVSRGDAAAAEHGMRAHLGRAELLLQHAITAHPDYFGDAEQAGP